MTLVFGAIFVLIFGGLVGFISLQYKQSNEKVAQNEALAVAEAGANWSRWRMAHSPNDLNFSGTYAYQDPESGTLGHYTIQVAPSDQCSTIDTIKITGWTDGYPNVKRAVQVQYGQPSMAEYAFMTNANVWFGPNEVLRGPFHSNGGIRMDGQQNALATSATSTYLCQPIHNCSPAQTKPGIWGSGNGGTLGLWEFPVTSFNFASITLDLNTLKTAATTTGYYFGKSGGFGYRVEFKNNGTFNLYKVTKLKSNVYACDTQGNCGNDSNDIDKQTLLGNYTLPTETCNAHNLIFLEDKKVWVDGVIKGKATVVAAQLPDLDATNASIIINGNISRADPRDTLVALIAQKNILVPLYAPNVLEIQAVMLAQKGAVQRLYYDSSNKPHDILNKISVRGSILSKNTWTWTWVDSYGTVISGYPDTSSYYEPALIYAPPPFFPVSGAQQFISWTEVSP